MKDFEGPVAVGGFNSDLLIPIIGAAGREFLPSRSEQTVARYICQREL